MANIINALNDAIANGYEVATIMGSGYDTEEYGITDLISEIEADHLSSISADMDIAVAGDLLTDDNGTLRIELRKPEPISDLELAQRLYTLSVYIDALRALTGMSGTREVEAVAKAAREYGASEVVPHLRVIPETEVIAGVCCLASNDDDSWEDPAISVGVEKIPYGVLWEYTVTSSTTRGGQCHSHGIKADGTIIFM